MATVNMTKHLTLYVYYKISADKSASYLPALKQLQQVIISRFPEIAIRQQKRPSLDATNHETWMETYAGVVQTKLEKLIADLSALAQLHGLPNERKYEVFMDL